MIGIVGGIGSYAGIDVIKKIYDLTQVTCDQDHLPISMLSVPHKVVDRTQFLLGKIKTNPGHAIQEIITTLASNGAQIIGIPCNTAHADPIFKVIKKQIPKSCRLIHLIEEVGTFISQQLPHIKKVGILSTTGTLVSKVYPTILQQYDLRVIEPSEELQNKVIHPAIFNKQYGLKACSNPINQIAKTNLITAATYLSEKGADAIILGCTEIPLAIHEEKIKNSIIIDATEILAKALIRESQA